MRMRQVKDRVELVELFNELGLTNKGVEIGVFLAEFSEQILKGWAAGKLYLVDPWGPCEAYTDYLQCTPEVGEERYQQALQRLQQFPRERWEIVREHSPGAANRFEDESLDWIYIDGNHSYEAVKADLAGWYPKVARGGIVAGHDYVNALPDRIRAIGVQVPDDYPTELLTTFGAKSAINEFIRGKDVQLYACIESSWYFRKP